MVKIKPFKGIRPPKEYAAEVVTSDKLGTTKHVRPLVVATELHIAAVLLEQVVEVVGPL